MCTVLGTIVAPYDTVKLWYWNFKNKDYGIQEAERSARPTEFDETRLRELVVEDQKSTTRELAKQLNISAMSISRAVYRIDLTYKSNRWTRHAMTQADKDRRVQACTNMLEYQHKDIVLVRIVTCDGKFIFFNNSIFDTPTI